MASKDLVTEEAVIPEKAVTATRRVRAVVATASEPKKAAEATIYVGPAIPGGKLGRYVVFKGGQLMPHIQELLDRTPAIQSLIVPVSQLGAVEKKLSDPASVESARFAEIRKAFSKGAQ